MYHFVRTNLVAGKGTDSTSKLDVNLNIIMAAWLESQFMQKYAYMHMTPILTLQPLKNGERGILLGMCQTYQLSKIIRQLLAFITLKEVEPFFKTISNLILVVFHIHKKSIP